MSKTKTGSGPPPPELDSPLGDSVGFLPTEAEDALGEGVVSLLDSGATQLLSTAILSGLSVGSADWGWADESWGPEASNPDGKVESGNLAAYVGYDVDLYTGGAAGAISNASTGGQDINLSTGFPEVSFVSGGGALDTAQMVATKDSAAPSAELQNYPSLSSTIDSVLARTYVPPSVSDAVTELPMPSIVVVPQSWTTPQITATVHVITPDAQPIPMGSANDSPSPQQSPPPAPPAPPPWPTAPTAPAVSDALPTNTPQAGAAPEPSPTQTISEQDWSAAKAGMQNRFVDFAELWLKTTFPITQLIPGHLLDGARAAPPEPTGNALRDYELRGNYEAGSTFINTVQAALSLAPLAEISEGASLAVSKALGPELESSLATELPSAGAPLETSTEIGALRSGSAGAASLAPDLKDALPRPTYPTSIFPRELGMGPSEQGYFTSSSARYGVRVGNATEPFGGWLESEHTTLDEAMETAFRVADEGKDALRQRFALNPYWGNRIETAWVVQKPASFEIVGSVGAQGSLPGGSFQIAIPRLQLEPILGVPISGD